MPEPAHQTDPLFAFTDDRGRTLRMLAADGTNTVISIDDPDLEAFGPVHVEVPPGVASDIAARLSAGCALADARWRQDSQREIAASVARFVETGLANDICVLLRAIGANVPHTRGALDVVAVELQESARGQHRNRYAPDRVIQAFTDGVHHGTIDEEPPLLDENSDDHNGEVRSVHHVLTTYRNLRLSDACSRTGVVPHQKILLKDWDTPKTVSDIFFEARRQ